MNFSTLFRLEENLHLDRKTLVNLRWIAIIGQLFAVNIVYNYLNLKFPVLESHIIIFLGLITNLYLQFGVKTNQLNDVHSLLFLIYDLFQLTILLYLTGGISNPFSLLLIVPAIVSSNFLSMRTTIMLGIITIILLFILTKFYLPLPGIIEYGFDFQYNMNNIELNLSYLMKKNIPIISNSNIPASNVNILGFNLLYLYNKITLRIENAIFLAKNNEFQGSHK